MTLAVLTGFCAFAGIESFLRHAGPPPTPAPTQLPAWLHKYRLVPENTVPLFFWGFGTLALRQENLRLGTGGQPGLPTSFFPGFDRYEGGLNTDQATGQMGNIHVHASIFENVRFLGPRPCLMVYIACMYWCRLIRVHCLMMDSAVKIFCLFPHLF